MQWPKDKRTKWQQWSTNYNQKQYHAPTENQGWNHVIRDGKQLLLHYWHPVALLMIRIVMYYEQGTSIHWLIVTECGNNFVQVFIVCFYLNCRWEVTVFLLSFSNVYLMIVLQIMGFMYNCINKSQVIKLNTNNTTPVPTKYLYIVNLYIRHSIFCLIREYFSNIILKVLDKTVEYPTFISFKLDKKRTRDNSFF
jgi:hypothetical protein